MTNLHLIRKITVILSNGKILRAMHKGCTHTFVEGSFESRLAMRVGYSSGYALIECNDIQDMKDAVEAIIAQFHISCIYDSNATPAEPARKWTEKPWLDSAIA